MFIFFQCPPFPDCTIPPASSTCPPPCEALTAKLPSVKATVLKKTSQLRSLQGQTLTDATPPIVGCKFRGSKLKFEIGYTRRCLSDENRLKTINYPYGITKKKGYKNPMGQPI